MTFTLTIELGNDAMQDGSDIAGALRKVAGKLAGCSARDLVGNSGKIMDVNGNSVGEWEVKS